MEDQVVSSAEAARHLGCHPTTICTYIRNGDLPATMILGVRGYSGFKYSIKLEDVLRLKVERAKKETRREKKIRRQKRASQRQDNMVAAIAAGRWNLFGKSGAEYVRKTRYCQYIINYHLLWATKCCAQVLVDDVKLYLIEVLVKTALGNDVEILDLDIRSNCVHLYISTPPRHSPAGLINTFKGVSSRRLRERFPDLQNIDPGSLWTRTYYINTAEHLSDESVHQYVDLCLEMQS